MRITPVYENRPAARINEVIIMLTINDAIETLNKTDLIPFHINIIECRESVNRYLFLITPHSLPISPEDSTWCYASVDKEEGNVKLFSPGTFLKEICDYNREEYDDLRYNVIQIPSDAG